MNKSESPKDSSPENKKGPTAPKYSEEELSAIFDEIIFSGEYAEDFKIKGKLPVTLRTRTAEEIDKIQHHLDASGSNLIATIESIRSLMHLQYAIVKYKGEDLSVYKIEEKAGFINKLPGPIVAALINTLAKFDEKVAMACKEGEVNF